MKEIIELNYIDTIIKLLNNAKEQVSKSINMTIVYTYYEIGKEIINQEQKGKNRAKYGEEILKKLSNTLTKEFGKGFSLSNLKMIRKFYLLYSNDKKKTTTG